jgi:uncharacterized DUF497 family protein
MGCAGFEWDEAKNQENTIRHDVSFEEAVRAFRDPKRVIIKDVDHSLSEERYHCMGIIERGIVTVRFTYRGRSIRILGAGYWRKGRKIYEEENQIYR